MLTHITTGDRGPHIFLLHWLGGSARTWQWVATALAAYGSRITAIDLPGFGDSAQLEANDAAQTATQVLDTLRTLRAEDPTAPWLLCGHSMGGKFAGIVARTAADGDPTLANLRGLFLISPSPPCPEPMKEETRQQWIETLGNPALDPEAFHKAAQQFLHDNTGVHPLQPNVLADALHDLERLNRAAFRAWFTTGSREDWASRVGTLTLPATVLAGDKEGPLCAIEQAKLLPRYLPNATLVTLEGSGHLAPLERPFEVADRIAAFAATIGLFANREAQLSAAFHQLLESNATSPQTREVMQQRLQQTNSTSFSAEEMLTLRALVRTVIPTAGPWLTERLAASIAAPQGNGWRFDDLPAVLEAWHLGLRSLDHAARAEHSVAFTALAAETAAELLTRATEGRLSRTIADTALPGEQHHVLTAAQMQHWMADVTGECSKIYVSDPRTMDRIHFHGFADEHGFTQIRLEEQA